MTHRSVWQDNYRKSHLAQFSGYSRKSYRKCLVRRLGYQRDYEAINKAICLSKAIDTDQSDLGIFNVLGMIESLSPCSVKRPQ
jgi:hypothetical protein